MMKGLAMSGAMKPPKANVKWSICIVGPEFSSQIFIRMAWAPEMDKGRGRSLNTGAVMPPNPSTACKEVWKHCKAMNRICKWCTRKQFAASINVANWLKFSNAKYCNHSLLGAVNAHEYLQLNRCPRVLSQFHAGTVVLQTLPDGKSKEGRRLLHAWFETGGIKTGKISKQPFTLL